MNFDAKSTVKDFELNFWFKGLWTSPTFDDFLVHQHNIYWQNHQWKLGKYLSKIQWYSLLIFYFHEKLICRVNGRHSPKDQTLSYNKKKCIIFIAPSLLLSLNPVEVVPTIFYFYKKKFFLNDFFFSIFFESNSCVSKMT
jgi:hypothetical protein